MLVIGNKKVICITLARGGSKSIPLKNITPLCGRPMLEYTLDEVKKSKYIDYYIVSTDHKDIMDVCKKNDVNIHNRPPHLALDTSKSADCLIDILKKFNNKYDYVVEVMVTNPLKTVEDIDTCIERLHITGADTVVSVVRVFDHHPARIKYINGDQLCDFYPESLESRRQDLMPWAYVRNGSVYALTVEALYSRRAKVGYDCRPYIMPQERSINVDEEMDLMIAELMLNEQQKPNI